MRFSLKQIVTLFSIGRVLKHLWATELNLADVAREGVSAQEIEKALCAKLQSNDPYGLTAPTARHSTHTGRTSYEVDSFGGIKVQISRLVNGWTKETGGMTVMSAEVDGMAETPTALTFAFNDGLVVRLVSPGVTLWIDRQFSEKRHFHALLHIVRAAYPAVADLMEKQAAEIIAADVEPVYVEPTPDPQLSIEFPAEPEPEFVEPVDWTAVLLGEQQ
jgi:hypothetical protein